MRILVIVLLFLLPISVFSQYFIGKEKRYVKKSLEEDVKKNPALNIIIKDQDSVLLYSIRDENYKPVDFIYHFDRSGKCRSQKVMAGCDSCYRKYLQDVLAMKKYAWKKINENQYVSKFNAFLILETHPDKGDYSYTILKADWNRKSYKILMGN